MRITERTSLSQRPMPSEYIRASGKFSNRIARASFGVLAMATLVLFAACGDSKSNDVTLATDTSLGRDLAMAATDTSVQPKLQDVPVEPPPATAPVATAPKPKPKPPVTAPVATSPAPATPEPAKPAEPKTGTIDAGTPLAFGVNAKVCSNTVTAGEKFTAQLSQSVSGSNGAVIPAGATGTFEVTEVKTAKNSNDKSILTVRLVAVTYDGNTYPVQGTVENAATTLSRSASKTTDAKKVAGGAAVGAIIGQIIGKDTKGTVIGAAAGAAAGTAAAAATADYDTCLNSGAAIAVRLDGPMTVRVGA